jgi:phosphoglycolate phosphatase
VVTIVTSNARENVQRLLGPANVGRIAHFECGASLFGKAAKIKTLLRKSGVSVADVISIGDETRDIEAARACGIRCAAVSWGYATRSALEAERPDLLFDRFEDITAALLPAGERV